MNFSIETFSYRTSLTGLVVDCLPFLRKFISKEAPIFYFDALTTLTDLAEASIIAYRVARFNRIKCESVLYAGISDARRPSKIRAG